MAITHAKIEYVISRGRVYANLLNIATDEFQGEIYLGNCPAFNVSIETEKAEHYSSETGLREKDASVVLEVKRSGSITCDNMNATNVALFLSGSTGAITQAAETVTGEVLAVLPGRYFQLGATAVNPVGARKVSNVVVKSADGSTEYVAGDDYNVDAERGRLQILEGGAIAAGDVQVDYETAACTWTGIRSGASGELRGSLRVVSDNATGENRDFYFPLVSLAPTGELPVIAEGTDFSSMSFDVDILKPAGGEAIYVDGIALAA